LRQFGGNLPPAVFQQRRKEFAKRMAAGEFLKQQQPSSSSSSDQQQQQQQQQQPGIDQQTAQMELMMDGMKKNMAAMLPQMVLMGWVNFVFAGFLLIRLPFPLTVRFKAMLQRGIETREMGVEWVSSLSWYFLNLFGLRGVFGLLLGENNGMMIVIIFCVN
jgi:hypothetical protein